MEPYIFYKDRFNNPALDRLKRKEQAKKKKLAILQAQIEKLQRLQKQVFQSGTISQYHRLVSMENARYRAIVKLLTSK